MGSTHRGEANAIAQTSGPPATRTRLLSDLRTLGLVEGSTVLVHSSLSSLGWVVGGAESVVLAIEDALGDGGTLMMPAYSMNAPEPALWSNPPVPESWWETIRAEWPPFDRDLSPTLRLGTIPETFRHQAGTRRSEHPNHSFCARGPNARSLLEHHSLDDSMGESSPLGSLYELHGFVLLLGVDHSTNSSLHLAEYRARWAGKHAAQPLRARLMRDGSIAAVTLRDLELNSEDFGKLGEDYETAPGAVRRGRVGLATGRLMDQRALVDYAVRWIEQHRTREVSSGTRS